MWRNKDRRERKIREREREKDRKERKIGERER